MLVLVVWSHVASIGAPTDVPENCLLAFRKRAPEEKKHGVERKKGANVFFGVRAAVTPIDALANEKCRMSFDWG